MHSLFLDRIAVLATMHRKETVIAPLLQQALGVQTWVAPDFNTDIFGTFTRDVDRPANQIETAKIKAKAALELTGESLAIASEGSFAPHPVLPSLPINREIVVLVDVQNDLEIMGEAISTETNFHHATITNLQDTQTFAEKVGFPTHGLVVMENAQNHQTIRPAKAHPFKADTAKIHTFKGITNQAELAEAVNWMLGKFGQAQIETDMRAMHNPTRMKVIAQATQDLIRKLQQPCPQCNRPGFDVVEHRAGLPCGLCGLPTQQTLAHLYLCQGCGFKQEILFPKGELSADPTYCSYCNP